LGRSARNKQGNMTRKTITYSSFGNDLNVFDLDTRTGAFTPVQTVAMPAGVQDAWPNQARTRLYVITSDSGPTSAVKKPDHFVQAFAIQPDGSLQEVGATVRLKRRPLSITMDREEAHVLLVYGAPSNVTVHALDTGGGIGDEVPQPKLEYGQTAHQVRVTPHGNIVVVPEAGHHPVGVVAGSVGLFSYSGGHMAPLGRIHADLSRAGPWQGKKQGAHGFAARHVDFHPTRSWMYLCVERQGELHLYDCDAAGVAMKPRAICSTLDGVTPGPSEQMAASVRVHPNGRFLYVTNRARDTQNADGRKVFIGGVNGVAVFSIDQDSGVPTPLQQVDSLGNFPRTFGIDADGKVLVVGNQDPMLVRGEGGEVRKVLPGMAVFAIAGDGRLTLINKQDYPDNGQACFWTGVVSLEA